MSRLDGVYQQENLFFQPRESGVNLAGSGTLAVGQPSSQDVDAGFTHGFHPQMAAQRPSPIRLATSKAFSVVPSWSPTFRYQPSSSLKDASGNWQRVAWLSCMS